MIPVSESVLVLVGQQVSPIRGTQHINLVIPAFDYIDLNNACLLEARDLVIEQWSSRTPLSSSDYIMVSISPPPIFIHHPTSMGHIYHTGYSELSYS